jgi:hypothetical protein
MSPDISASVLREIETELSYPLFYGMPLGPALNDTLVIRLSWGHADWRRSRRVSQARRLQMWLRPRRSDPSGTPLPSGRILVTWNSHTPRFNDMLLPVVGELEKDGCAVVYWSADVASLLPSGVPGVGWGELMTYDVRAWREEYARCRPEWRRRLKSVCARFDLPKATFELLSADLMMASQRVAGCLEFLKRERPAAILTEFDRSNLWACLVLAARSLQIPTTTLVHGVIERGAVGFSLALADTVVCWGKLDREKLLEAGEPAEKIVIGGCPRLSRELGVTKAQGCAKLGVEADKPLVLFATSPGYRHLEVAELFCVGAEALDSTLAMVRLHPSEKPQTYSTIARRHPGVIFSSASQATLDESLAAADVVVACNSGVGSDALLKRRPVVVLNPEATPSGNDHDLVELAGCPHARTSGELATAVQRMLNDHSYRAQNFESSELYVSDFCEAFGLDSARRIASVVREAAGRRSRSGGSAEKREVLT